MWKALPSVRRSAASAKERSGAPRILPWATNRCILQLQAPSCLASLLSQRRWHAEVGGGTPAEFQWAGRGPERAHVGRRFRLPWFSLHQSAEEFTFKRDTCGPEKINSEILFPKKMICVGKHRNRELHRKNSFSFFCCCFFLLSYFQRKSELLLVP